MPEEDLPGLLSRLGENTMAAEPDLAEQIYSHMRRMAREIMARERADHTLQPTALANEIWLKLANRSDPDYVDRQHFFAVAATAMRRHLVDHARARARRRRNQDEAVRRSHDDPVLVQNQTDGMAALDQALWRLERTDPRLVRIVELRWFCDLSVEETAAVLNLSPTTVKREWRIAKALLLDDLAATRPAPQSE